MRKTSFKAIFEAYWNEFNASEDYDSRAAQTELREAKKRIGEHANDLEAILTDLAQRYGDEDHSIKLALYHLQEVLLEALAMRCQRGVSDRRIFRSEQARSHGQRSSDARRQEMDSWHSYVRQRLNEISKKNPSRQSAPSLATNILRDWTHPGLTPVHSTIVDFIRRERRPAQKTLD